MQAFGGPRRPREDPNSANPADRVRPRGDAAVPQNLDAEVVAAILVPENGD